MDQISISPFQMDTSWLITSASYLSDRIVPACEQVFLPAAEVAGGTLQFGYGPLPAPRSTGGRLAQLRKGGLRKSAPLPLPHRNVFDLRRNDPDNWAHFLNNHLPIVFQVCAQMGIDPGETLLVLPDATPGYIRAAADLMGIEILTTDAALDGEGICYDATPWTGIRPVRANWAQQEYPTERLSALSAASDLPKRVFLSRRGTRALLNEAEVADWLKPRGFQTVYPEDLSAADQIALFRGAEQMVAVHGAGLAPLLYAPAGDRPRHLVEILHAGHMTQVYRVMAQQCGWGWTGVRGRLKPEYIRAAYDFDTPFKAYSLDNFELDIGALERAFDLAGIA